MSETVFFRLLKLPVDEKGDALATRISSFNRRSLGDETFVTNAILFDKIPGSPFAYWATHKAFGLFEYGIRFDAAGNTATKGLASTDDFQFLRLAWEVKPEESGWRPFAKGGIFSKYYAGVSLAIDWSNDGKSLKDFLDIKIGGYLGANQWSRWINGFSYYFLPGLTWPSRTNGFSVRVLPADCVFGHKAGVTFRSSPDETSTLILLAIMNSMAFNYLIQIQLARTELARSYEVGLIQNTPVPDLSDPLARNRLADLALQAHDLQRQRDLGDETTHVFGLPSLLRHTDASLLQAGLRLDQAEQVRRVALAAVQAEIDDLAFDLYGLDETDRAAIRVEMGGAPEDSSDAASAGLEENEAEDEEEAAPPEDLPLRVQNLLMWCVSAAFGRWDVRMALDSSLLPALQGPFDPLPRCAPGALIGTDGLPARKDHIAGEAWLRSRKDVLDLPGPGMPGAALDADAYPFPVAWDGILVDDENHPADLVARVEQVIRLLWGDRGDDIIQEACDILGFPDLRSYFRDPRKGFYAFHIKRYSKSRRKAPIYWLLQSEKRSYGIWLYVHRMGEMTLLEAARKPYADSKVLLEEARLDELQQSLGALEGSARKRREREIERQQKLVDEVTSFRNTLDKVAAMKLPPDLNDGVIISIAPLHALTPWNEAKKMWAQLASGAYDWSTMAQQMRRRGFVKMTSSR